MREAFLTDAARRFNDEFQFCARKLCGFRRESSRVRILSGAPDVCRGGDCVSLQNLVSVRHLNGGLIVANNEITDMEIRAYEPLRIESQKLMHVKGTKFSHGHLTDVSGKKQTFENVDFSYSVITRGYFHQRSNTSGGAK